MKTPDKATPKVNETTARDTTSNISQTSAQPSQDSNNVKKITHVNAVLQAIRRINQLVLRAKTGDELLAEACNALTVTLGYYNAWIMKLDGSGSVVSGVQSGLAENFSTVCDAAKSGNLPLCAQQALETNALVVIENPVETCRTCELAPYYKKRSAFSIRLGYENRTWGILTASIPSDYASDADERQLFEELTSDLSAGLYRLELEHEKNRTENMFHTIMEDLPGALFAHDLDGNFVLTNEAACRFTGYSREELLAMNVRDIDPNSIERSRLHENWKTMKFGDSVVIESKHLRKDGSSYPAEIRLNAMELNGKPIMLAIAYDISDRLLMQEALSQSESKYRLIAENTLDAIWTMDMNLTFTYVNQACVDILGYTPEEWIDSSLASHCDEANFSYMAQVISQEALNSFDTKGIVFEAELLHKNGRTIPVEIHGAVMRDRQGNPLGLQGVTRDISERKTAEAELRESENRFRIVSELSSDYAYALRLMPDGRLKPAWHAGKFESFSGYSQDEFYEMGGLKKLIHPEDLPRAETFIKTLLSGKTASLTARIVTKSGQTRWIQDTSRPWIDKETGKVIGTMGAAKDITELKETEQALQAALHQQNAIFESSLVGIMVLHNRIITKVNSRMADMLGFTPEELEGHSPEKIHLSHDNYIEFGDNYYWRLGQQTIVQIEYPLRHKEGRAVWCQFSGRAIAAPDLSRGAVWVIDDITERKRSQAMLQVRTDLLEFASTHSLDELLEKAIDEVCELVNSPIGFYHFVHADQTMLTLAAWSSQTKQKFCNAVGAGSHYSIDQAGVWVDCVRERRPVIHNDYASLPHKKGMPEGHAAVIQELVVPIFREDKVVAIMGVGNKPDDYNEKDIEIVTYLADIAWEIAVSKHAEEDKARLEQQLLQSQKMESIGRLAGGVAHDFNNLLTGITGNVALAMMELSPGDPLEESLKEIDEAAQSAAEVTSQLLAFSRKQIIQPKVIDLNELLETMHKMLIRLIGEDVDFQSIPSRDLARVKADPGQMQQVLINMAINARDAMPDGGKLTIETRNVTLDEHYCQLRQQLTPGDYVCLTISDSGVGMDSETKANIFDPFFTTKREGEGTGLGLAMAYGIIKQHDGHIDVYSEIGEGTSFKLYLPALQDRAEPVSRTKPFSQLPTGTETVLVVEDEPIVRNIAIKILKMQGYTVHSADSGGNAIAMVEKRNLSPDLLMTDIIMPNMNGRELAEKLRAKQPGLKILYTSGYTENVIAHHGVLEEGIRFLGKPYTPQDLAKAVRATIDEA